MFIFLARARGKKRGKATNLMDSEGKISFILIVVFTTAEKKPFLQTLQENPQILPQSARDSKEKRFV